MRNVDSKRYYAGYFYGQFLLDLKLSGSSLNDYDSSQVTVNVLSSVSPIPAPSIHKAIFSDSGGFIVIQFDSATNFAGVSTPFWPCSSLFEFSDAATTQCTWINATFAQVCLFIWKYLFYIYSLHNLIYVQDKFIWTCNHKLNNTGFCYWLCRVFAQRKYYSVTKNITSQLSY